MFFSFQREVSLCSYCCFWTTVRGRRRVISSTQDYFRSARVVSFLPDFSSTILVSGGHQSVSKKALSSEASTS
jgi:hypothetical protein